jgi:hypothetical protein
VARLLWYVTFAALKVRLRGGAAAEPKSSLSKGLSQLRIKVESSPMMGAMRSHYVQVATEKSE